MRKFFARNGTLSQWHPHYEFRAGQLEMAEAVEQAFHDRRHLLVERNYGQIPNNPHSKIQICKFQYLNNQILNLHNPI